MARGVKPTQFSRSRSGSFRLPQPPRPGTTDIVQKPMKNSLIPSAEIHLSNVSERHKFSETCPLSK